MTWRLILAFTMGAACCFAQFPKDGIPGPCTGQQAREYPGAWVKTPDDLSELAQSGLTAPQRAALLAKADQALAILRKAYPNPRGVNVWHYRWAYHSRFKTLPVPLSANLIFMQYRCYSDYRGTGQPRLVVEQNSDAWVQIEFNTPGQALRGELPDGYELPSGAAVYWSPIEFGPEFRGVPTLKGTIEVNTTTILLGKDNRLPVRPVTREEILRVHADYWRKRKQEEIAKLEKDLARDRKLLAEHKPRPGQSSELFAQNEATYRERIERSAALLGQANEELVSLPVRVLAQIEAMTPEQRNSQAVIDPVNTNAYVDLQFGPGGNRRPLWTMDDVYLANASRNAVHYMTIFWRRCRACRPRKPPSTNSSPTWIWKPFAPCSTGKEIAFHQAAAWLEQPNVTSVQPAARHQRVQGAPVLTDSQAALT